jgi:hypothetical protein
MKQLTLASVGFERYADEPSSFMHSVVTPIDVADRAE